MVNCLDQLRDVLLAHRAADLGDAVAVLALDPWWLDPHGDLGRLLDHVRRVGVPIAVVLEHAKDPLGQAGTIDGLLALLGVGVPVIQLRCDVSGLGLLSHGAWAAAVGTRSSLRHLYPNSPGGWHPPVSVATVVRDCLAYHEVGLIARAVRDDPENSLWQECTCRACNAQQLDWIARLVGQDAQERAAFGHALEILFDLRDDLTALSNRADREMSWRAQCSGALARYKEINAAGHGWTVPKSLRRWYDIVVPTSAATR